MAMLLVSQGVPMLLMGDEVGRTQHGNNNAYCHDNALNWFDWNLVEENAELLRFVRNLHRPALEACRSCAAATTRPAPTSADRLPGHQLARHDGVAARLVVRQPRPGVHAQRHNAR